MADYQINGEKVKMGVSTLALPKTNGQKLNNYSLDNLELDSNG